MARQALTDMLATPKGNPKKMADWLEQCFGPKLMELFFGAFHDLYTAGLWTRVAPQDPYKSSVNTSLVIRGAFGQTPPVGYNATFIYPEQDLSISAQKMAQCCEIHYGKRVAGIDIQRKEVFFADRSAVRYETLISTLPLNKMVEMTGLELDEGPDPYTSVLVLNIGARQGFKCPMSIGSIFRIVVRASTV
jgi:protoporphyrinogen oxidase